MKPGRSSITVRLARRIQQAPLWLLQFIEWPFVAMLSRKRGASSAIFLLALPRSGSTVTYQAICHGLSVNYLSNLWHLLYQLPLVGGWLSAKKAQHHHSDFTSQHGFVAGLDGPAEGLRFWRWWLGCGLSDAECSDLQTNKLDKRTSYLRRVLSVLTRNSQPFATAYLGHALLPDTVERAFQGAVLIRLKREPVSNALSLLRSMRKGNVDWFSVMPSECEGLANATEYERVAAQVYWLNRRLDDAVCAAKMLTVHYEKLCENPEKEIERIQHWCNDKGVPVTRKLKLPDSFSFKKVNLKSDPDAMAIRRALDELEAKHGKLENSE